MARYYSAEDKARILKMIEAFELCKKDCGWQGTYACIYLCHRLDYLHVNNQISNETLRHCTTLIRKALGAGCYSLDTYMRKQGMEVQLCDDQLRWSLRERWLNQIIKDLDSYL